MAIFKFHNEDFVKMTQLRMGCSTTIMLLTQILGCVAAQSATFDILQSRKHGDWEAVLYNNEAGNRRFCAAETYSSGGTVFRLTFYPEDRFLEFFNPKWQLLEGQARFSIVVDNGTEAKLKGHSELTAYTYDFVEVTKMQILLGMLVDGKTVELLNSNGASVDKFSLSGSGNAISDLFACYNTLTNGG